MARKGAQHPRLCEPCWVGHLSVEQRGNVALVRIDRPPANALDPTLLAEGRRLLDELASAQAEAVVLTGREGFFSAGVDLKVAPMLDARGQREMVDGISRVFAGWYAFERPVVCAVNGHAIAGGLILALCGDYRVATGHGRFGLTELRVGVPYPAVALAIVKAELSPPVARRLVLGADLVDARTALELGLLDELTEPDLLLSRALELAEELARLPAAVYAHVKRQLRRETIDSNAQIVEGDLDPLLRGWLAEETPAAAATVLARERE
jgi:enoyl-CoA hydratase